MNITLKNDIIEKALDLRSENFHFYMSLVYVSKQEKSQSDVSLTYVQDSNSLHIELQKYFDYSKGMTAFNKNMEKLRDLRLIKEGINTYRQMITLHLGTT